jgi:hypothetical protein
MTDVELLESLLRCQQISFADNKPNADETDTQKYLRWAIEAVAKRIWWDNKKN